MKPVKTITIKNSRGEEMECLVQTLREWLNERIASLRRLIREDYYDDNSVINAEGRLAELLIIREKINDRRIDEI